MKQLGLVSLWACTLLVLATSVEARYQGVCRLPLAEGFEKNHARAEATLARIANMTTSDRSQAVVYVERYSPTFEEGVYSPGGFYAHSNYVTPGFNVTTKVVEQKIDLINILGNVYYTNEKFLNLTTIEKEEVRMAYRDQVTFLIHENVFSEKGYPLDLRDLRQFYIVDSKGTLLRIKRKGKDRRKLRCEPDSPCWDDKKQQVKQICEGDPVAALLMALVKGAFAGLGCKVEISKLN